MTDYSVCPFKMSDGRYFTDYRPKSHTNAELFEKLQDNNIINSSSDSRFYLQHNAEQIMKDNYQKAIDSILPCSLKTDLINNKVMDNKYIIKCDPVSCKKVEVNPDGIGTSVNY